MRSIRNESVPFPIHSVDQKSKLLYCDRYCNSHNVKYSIILWTDQDLKVGNTNSFYVVKYSVQQTFINFAKLVRVCLAVISLTAFSHRIFKHKTIVTLKYFTWKYQVMFHFLRRRSYLFMLLMSSQCYWHIRVKSNSLLFDPPCTT